MENASEDVRIGVSGGHTKANAIAIVPSSSGAWSVIGSSHIQEGLNQHFSGAAEFGRRFKRLLELLGEDIGSKERLRTYCKGICVALPGAATQKDLELGEGGVDRGGWWSNKVKIIDDTWAGLIAGTESSKGICAFAGTGASVFVGLGGFHFDRKYKIDGWGAFLGDRGSGLEVALGILRSVALDADRGVDTPLGEVVCASLGISSPVLLQKWMDQARQRNPTTWHIEVARLAEIAVTRAENGDPSCRDLVAGAAREIALSVQIAIERFAPKQADLPVVFQGGMFEHSRLFRDTVIECLQKSISNPVRMAIARPLLGAAVVAAQPEGFDLHEARPLLPINFDHVPPRCWALLYY